MFQQCHGQVWSMAGLRQAPSACTMVAGCRLCAARWAWCIAENAALSLQFDCCSSAEPHICKIFKCLSGKPGQHAAACSCGNCDPSHAGVCVPFW